MSQFPIFCNVERGEMTPVRFGARENIEIDVLVGTSAKNSHQLARVTVERYEIDGDSVGFLLSVDGVLVKSGRLTGKEFMPRNLVDDRVFLTDDDGEPLRQ